MMSSRVNVEKNLCSIYFPPCQEQLVGNYLSNRPRKAKVVKKLRNQKMIIPYEITPQLPSSFLERKTEVPTLAFLLHPLKCKQNYVPNNLPKRSMKSHLQGHFLLLLICFSSLILAEMSLSHEVWSTYIPLLKFSWVKRAKTTKVPHYWDII